jgi:hypothetical protein
MVFRHAVTSEPSVQRATSRTAEPAAGVAPAGERQKKSDPDAAKGKLSL